jgi:diguanylate cyclase
MAEPGPVEGAAPAVLAKGALRRLALARLEPTPENYAKAYAEEAGQGTPLLPDKLAPLLAKMAEALCDEPEQREALVTGLMQGRWQPSLELLNERGQARQEAAAAWAETLRRLVQSLDRPSQEWPAGRRRESVQRVLASSGRDQARLQQRLASLVSAWDGDAPSVAGLETLHAPEAAEVAGPNAATTQTASALAAIADAHGPAISQALNQTVQAALPPEDSSAQSLLAELVTLGQRIGGQGVSAVLLAEVEAACVKARQFFGQRHRLVEELSQLCRELGRGVTELAEEESWARGQSEQLQARLADGINLRNVRAASVVLAQARQQQATVRGQRQAARDALKLMIQQMLQELDGLGTQTDRFHDALGRHAEAVQGADTLESLADVVRDMVAESRAVQQVVNTTRLRMRDEHAKANELQARVAALEEELRQMSDVATTDALTQVANRRGLTMAFDTELARIARATGVAPTLSLALIDIDNFKKLNDTLGHAAGDEALRKLAAAVRERLRPGDHFARFGGEEFVVVLPATAAAEAQEVITRLQRGLTASLFMHGDKEVFVTFSGGVTAWRPGETLEAALERADIGLYEAKRTGKNRTCEA